ncbi:MAG: GNAT family N-acetyltransferase [Candidatus Niyogibacteria bacterium]|nr:MAG: GNAT family N-acetyltransferase [Candidatus Niyogibacteria bacterium]
MKIHALTPSDCGRWDDFCLESDDAWFWHTFGWLKYTLDYKPEYKPRSLSFFMEEGGRIIAISPLILEERGSVKEFSYGGGWGPIPALANDLTKNEREKITKAVFEEIDRKAKEEGVKLAKFRFSTLNKSFIETGEQKFNHLMKFGYFGEMLNTQVIDLSRSLDVLRGALRHGHDSDISRAEKSLKAEVYDSETITGPVFEEYVKLHHKASGRSTRPRSTFDMMHKWIENKNAFLVGVKKDGKFAGFSYFFSFKNNVYYGSSCNDPDVEKMPIGHLIQWTAIRWMREKNFGFYEIGWQQYGNTLFDFPSEKEIDIARFKRGFGGETYPLFIGEKYYDKDYFLTIYKQRIGDYSGFLAKTHHEEQPIQ